MGSGLDLTPLWVRAARVWARFRFGVGVRARVRVQHADLLVLHDDALARHVAARVQAAHLGRVEGGVRVRVRVRLRLRLRCRPRTSASGWPP